MSRIDTWMPLYIGDYLRDTGHLSAEEHGAYLLLLMQSWTREGLLPGDDERVRLLAKLDAKAWKHSRATILEFFIKTPDGYRHKRLDRELANTQAMVEQRRSAGKASAEARAKQRAQNERDDDGSDGSGSEGNGDGNGTGNDRPTTVETGMAAEAPRNGRPSPSPSPSQLERNPVASLPRPADDADEAVSTWNEMAGRNGLSKVATLTDKRRKHLRQRLKECGGIEGWRDAMALVEQSPFLRGEVRDWKADFDFVLQQSSFTKLMEGSYGNRGQAKKSGGGWEELDRRFTEMNNAPADPFTLFPAIEGNA